MVDRGGSGQGGVKPAPRGVLDVACGVLGDLDLERVLERVLESARELTGARYAAIGVLDESRTALARFVTTGVDAATRRQIGPLPTGHGVLGELIRHPAPLHRRRELRFTAVGLDGGERSTIVSCALAETLEDGRLRAQVALHPGEEALLDVRFDVVHWS